MRTVGGADARGRIAAQGDEALHAHIGEFLDYGVDLMAGGVDAGQVRGWRQAGLLQDAADGARGALTR